MLPTSKNGNKKKHQTVNFVNIMRLSYIYLNYCTAELKRYEWRHDSINQTIMNNLVAIASDTCRSYADINGYECQSTLFESKRPNETNAEMYRSRPDIIIREGNCVAVIELTCPFETNLLNSHD